MAGMFGSIGRYLSNPDNLANIGATLKDVGANLNGEDGNNVLLVQKAVQDRKAKAAKDAFAQQLAGLIGGRNPGAATGSVAGGGFMSQDTLPQVQAPPRGAISESLPSGGGGLNANSPELPGLVMAAQNAGYSMDDILKVLQMQQPDVRYDRGFGYNGKTGASAGGFHPDMDKGQEPVFDQNGRIVGVRNMDGAIQSAADMAGAVSGAQERAKAGYDLVPVPQSDGSTRMMPRLSAVGALGGGGGVGVGGGASGGAMPGGPSLGVSQTPAAASAAKIRGDAQATAQVDMPGRFGAIDNSIDIATRLRNDPVLAKRTGAYAMLPAIPGTHGVAWDAMKKQLLGQVFMDSYSELKGGGQITEVEGAKATQAKARLEAAQTPDDFKAALDDYIGALNRGKALMAQKAGGGSSPQAASPGRAAIEAEMRRRGLIH